MTDVSNPRAFPSVAIDDKCGGMSLRDWFAGKAMAAALSLPDVDDSNYEGVAQHAYYMADAMLEERERRRG